MPDWMWFENVVFPMIGMAMGTLVLIGAYRTVNRALERRHERQLAALRGPGSADTQRLAERLDAMEEQLTRVGELEDRIDFTERLLARQREKGELGPGR